MTPQERQLVTELFDRLSRLETTPRDADAERTIADGLTRAPNALYPLVQTVLVQDEALKRADARIRELSGAGGGVATGGGFLENMRNTLTGSRPTSVPSVHAASSNQSDPRWNSGGALPPTSQYAAPVAPPAHSGSFLGTAAASAAGVIGGALLFNSIGSLFGHRGGSSFGDVSPANSSSPWANNAAGSDLSRDAGLDDIGSDGRSAGLLDAGSDGVDLSDGGGDFSSGDSV